MKKLFFYVLILTGTIGYSQNWRTNFDEAKAESIRENKNIVLVFSGSDWCAPCMKLDKTVWQSDIFKTESEKNWVIYKADFPKKKANQLPVEVTEMNKKLAEKYNKNGSFPLVVIIDKNGKVLGVTGFKNVTATEYVSLIYSFEK
jgi:thioredoxin-related protein